jgi:hypothetical protein
MRRLRTKVSKEGEIEGGSSFQELNNPETSCVPIPLRFFAETDAKSRRHKLLSAFAVRAPS